MGDCCSKHGAAADPPVSRNIPQPNPRTTNNERAPVNNSPLITTHINQRYSQFFDVIRDKRTGTGIKQTQSYKSKIPKEELEKKRNEYWETQVEGNTAVWQVLRSACEEPDEETALAMLAAADVRLVNKNLQQAYDSLGAKYDVPIFCINDPVEYNIPKKKQLNVESLNEPLNIKIRRVGVVHDVEIETTKGATVLSLKEAYLSKVKEEGLQLNKLRMIYGGREMTDNSRLVEYALENEHVVQVFVRK